MTIITKSDLINIENIFYKLSTDMAKKIFTDN